VQRRRQRTLIRHTRPSQLLSSSDDAREVRSSNSSEISENIVGDSLTTIKARSLRGAFNSRRWGAARKQRIESINIKETTINRLLYSSAIFLVILGSAGTVTAQNANDATQSNNAHPNLNPTQQQMVSTGLASRPSQSAPSGAQPQVGDKVPDSMSAQSMPHNVGEQVPEAKQLLFVKLPDRILLIDPDTKLVSEIVTEPATTGSAASSQDRQGH
jgi:hypothetical protein